MPCLWPPPVYAKLYRETNNRKYLQFMDNEYRATYEYLSIRKRTFSTAIGIISVKKKPMAKRYSGDVEMPGYWPVWQKYCRSCPKVDGTRLLRRTVYPVMHTYRRIAERRRLLACQPSGSGFLSFSRNQFHRFLCICVGLWRKCGTLE